jgi:hypothetical protein
VFVVKPLTVIVPDPACESVPVIPPGEDVAIYDVIGELPELLGAVNETVAVVDPVDVAVPIVGALGGDDEDVVVELLSALYALSPTEFVALTLNVYEVPAVNPVILIVPEPD